MLTLFVILGVIAGLLMGFIMMIRMADEWGLAGILMIPVCAFLGGSIFYAVHFKIDTIARFNTTYGLSILGIGVLVVGVIYAAIHHEMLVTRIKALIKRAPSR